MPEYPGSVPRILVAAYNFLKLQFQEISGPLLASVAPGTHTFMEAKTQTHKITN